MTDTDFEELIDLAAERTGGAVVFANDDFFAEKENLLKPQPAVFIEGKYTDRGKWMDGWESRRRRVPGHDRAIVRLGLPGIVRGVVIDTAFFKGNYPEHASIEACSASGHASPEELEGERTSWLEILPKSRLAGDSKNRFPIDASVRATHLRLHIYPDGGVARLRVHGDVVPDPRWMGKPGSDVDLAAAEHGGLVLACNDMFFGSRHNLIMPGRGVNMGDGWETKRSRREGPDWVVVRLAAEGVLEHVEVDTRHFKGNYPESCSLHGTRDAGADPAADSAVWEEVLPRTKLLPDTRHVFSSELAARGPFARVRLRIYPDGGVSRLRVVGAVTREARQAARLRHLASLSDGALHAAFLACCGSTRWAAAMTAARPVASLDALQGASARAFEDLGKDDWLEAFRAHPKIGGKSAEAHASQASKVWSSSEQSRVADASQATLDALADVNRAYEAKFGHIYIVCATGKSADEMLAIARARLENDGPEELARAAAEQEKITYLRLEKLVTG